MRQFLDNPQHSFLIWEGRTRLLKPVFSVPYQTFSTKAALVNVKKGVEIQ
jgi:hypothetical protein